MPQALFHSSNSLHAGASTTRFSTPRPWATRCHLPQRMKRAKKLVKELPNSVARIGADAPSSVHRRRRALVFSEAGGRAGRPEPKAPCLHISALTVARPHCCSLKSVVRRCNTRCSRGGRAPLQMRARPYFGAHAYHTPVLNRSSLRAGIGPPELLRIPLPHALLETGRRPSTS